MTATSANPSVLVMGEALIDLVLDPRLEDPSPQAVPGGSPANVALALSRLGLEVDLVTWIGKDNYGELIKEHLESSHVRITEGSYGASATPTAKAQLNMSGAATYTFDLEWEPLNPVEIPSTAEMVHTGSIGAVLKPGTFAVLDAFRRARSQAVTSYDPNARPSLMGAAEEAREIVESFVRLSDVVKVSDEDLEWLYPSPALDSAKRWTHELGVPVLIMTRGKLGPIAWTKNGAEVEVTPADVKVIDTVGAGDTFMGGLIDALWRRGYRGAGQAEALSAITGEELKAIVEDAAEVADIVVQRRGANPPWASELGR